MDTGPYVICPSDCSQVRWFLRSTQAAAAAGQELRVLGLAVGVPEAVASGVVRGSGDDAPIAAARAVPWSARVGCVPRVGCVTRDGAFSREWWPPCHPAAVVTATIKKARTPVSR
jgi:hypothetical protein